jgi:lysophospholipase L1-like esterase
MTKHYHSWLALGDSYTIGEAVALHESFPYQALQLLRKTGQHFYAPEIVAKTGWTTFELAEHLLHTRLNEQYDFVTLSIGVNNQYRGLPIEDYKTDVEFLIKKAIHFAGNKAERVIVISIPDWGATPFAVDRDKSKIGLEIDDHNEAKKLLSEKYSVAFIDITTDQRAEEDNAAFVASDKLHPSGKEYAKWAEKVAAQILSVLKS